MQLEPVGGIAHKLHLVTWVRWPLQLYQPSQKHTSLVLTQTTFVHGKVTPKDSSDNNITGVKKLSNDEFIQKLQFEWY